MSDKFALVIERMPDGGFVVSDGSFRRDPGSLAFALFASHDIGRALGYIREQLAPNVATPEDPVACYGQLSGVAQCDLKALEASFPGVVQAAEKRTAEMLEMRDREYAALRPEPSPIAGAGNARCCNKKGGDR